MAEKILVVGGGGREHAIIKALKKSPDCGEIWCAPGNGGISYDAKCKNIKATDVDTMVGFAVEEKFDYVVVAQDDPLALGMVDALAKAGIPRPSMTPQRSWITSAPRASTRWSSRRTVLRWARAC